MREKKKELNFGFWLKSAAEEKVEIGDHWVFLLRKKIVFNDVAFKQNRWYVLPEKKFKKLQETLIKLAQSSENEENKNIIIKDYALTDLITALFKNNWSITKENLSEAFIDAFTHGLFNKEVLLCNTGHTYDKTSLENYKSSLQQNAPLQDPNGREEIKSLARHEIINSLIKRLEEYKDEDTVNLKTWFAELEDKSIADWVSTETYFSKNPSNARRTIYEDPNDMSRMIFVTILLTAIFAFFQNFSALSIVILLAFLYMLVAILSLCGCTSPWTTVGRSLDSLALWVSRIGDDQNNNPPRNNPQDEDIKINECFEVAPDFDIEANDCSENLNEGDEKGKTNVSSENFNEEHEEQQEGRLKFD